MRRRVLIRFAGERGRACHFLKLGPMDVRNPPEREFQGEEEVTVMMEETTGKPECVDIEFDDGQYALEVPKEFFVVLDDMTGR
jgi:hypothetical protein